MLALPLALRSRFQIPGLPGQHELGDGIGDDVGAEKPQRAVRPDDNDREHRPERDQEDVEEPADARCHYAEDGKQSDDAENERAQQDAHRPRQFRTVDLHQRPAAA
ncbi:MAG TPA: hypothetical protein VGK37_14155 [Casimicrobiaceae bacterium]|jgi:hypothetical protein